MTLYVDRDNLKWIPFLMPEHKTMFKQYYREVHQLDVPNYDQRLDLQIENVLNATIFNGGLLRIVAHHNGIEFKFNAYVEKLDYQTDTITLRKSNYQEEKSKVRSDDRSIESILSICPSRKMISAQRADSSKANTTRKRPI